MSLSSKTLLAYDKVESPEIKSNNVYIDGSGSIEFLDDGEIALSNGASGWPYTIGINEELDNGAIYDLGLIFEATDLSNLSFTGNDEVVQTAEVWFTTDETIYPITWPENMIWIDTIDGSMPILTPNLHYRCSIRKEPQYLVASISYTFAKR